MAKAKGITIKRVYETPSPDDGYRMLIDRLWPRGLKKEKAQVDEWNKAIAPTDELRHWYTHKPERYKEFAKKYREELTANADEVNKIKQLAKKRTVTLVYAAKDVELSNASVLLKFLNE